MALSGADFKRIKEMFAELYPPAPDVGLRLHRVEDTTEKLSAILCGNGEKGMDETVREIEKRVGVVESDVKEVKQMLQQIVGYKGVRYDEGNHPGRRAGDEAPKGNADKALSWFTGKVLPGLTQAVIIAITTAIFVLIVQNAAP